MAENHINLNCESCGADLSIKKGEASVTCGFCSTLNKPTAENQSPTNKQKTMFPNLQTANCLQKSSNCTCRERKERKN